MRRGVIFAAVLTALLASPATASATRGSIGVRLLDVPAQSVTDSRARLYVVDHLAPGTDIHRRIEVSNSAASIAHVALYPAAATIRGGSFLGAAGHTPNDLASWTSVSPAKAAVPAHGHVTARLSISVPPDAAPGERYGVVWAEVRSTSAGADIIQINRVGIRVYLSVGRGGPPAANFAIDSLIARRTSDNQPIVVAAVHNTGGRALDMSGNLRLRSGPGGLSAGPFAANLGTTLAIGDTEPVVIALDKRVPAGPWDAQVILRSGLLMRRARATITFPEPKGKATPYFTVVGLTLLVLVTIAALLVALQRRRRVTNRRDTPALPPTWGAGDSGAAADAVQEALHEAVSSPGGAVTETSV